MNNNNNNNNNDNNTISPSILLTREAARVRYENYQRRMNHRNLIESTVVNNDNQNNKNIQNNDCKSDNNNNNNINNNNNKINNDNSSESFIDDELLAYKLQTEWNNEYENNNNKKNSNTITNNRNNRNIRSYSDYNNSNNNNRSRVHVNNSETNESNKQAIEIQDEQLARRLAEEINNGYNHHHNNNNRSNNNHNILTPTATATTSSVSSSLSSSSSSSSSSSDAIRDLEYAQYLQNEEARLLAEETKVEELQQDTIQRQILAQLHYLRNIGAIPVNNILYSTLANTTSNSIRNSTTAAARLGDVNYTPRTRPPDLMSSLINHSIDYRNLRQFNGTNQPNIDIDNMSYDELLELSERIGEVKSRGLSQSEINRLPSSIYSKKLNTLGADANRNSSENLDRMNKRLNTGTHTINHSNGQINDNGLTTIDLTNEEPTATHPNTILSESSEQCAICLNEFEDGDSIRRLPCLHCFHDFELDKWLTTNNKCPICRIVVGVKEV